MNRVSPEALGKDKYWKKGEVPAERFDKQKQTGGMVLEYMEHMIYGFEPPQIVPFWKGTKVGRTACFFCFLSVCA
ncbi:unnamed protein product [Prorocentrum cordatum]|uniref:Uncharacterized protein n=1 Tax=Prorocentrum cordatum TaxID=2364126 RepID=A0ABN9STK0_9DINO|nr:unnamed protein product [Polarella glacialis]